MKNVLENTTNTLNEEKYIPKEDEIKRRQRSQVTMGEDYKQIK